MIIDRNRMRSMTKNNQKLISTVSQLFLNELPDMILNIEHAYQAANRDELANAVHRLKSGLGNFVTSDYYQEFSYIEMIARDNKPPIVPLDKWFDEWDHTKSKLDILSAELKEMAGI
ncbi:Uncharacterised protein [Zhongshania aliphaticivorans]|uniref:HPt domain-containing protein n=1 Tax=Zhongshania aliphaticivorans TaxID=1470434 RepID=A0A5S9NMB6_9GAMM|nr:Hpt domain-containing protein [Zhongshania aliphaticivorans]CAA0091302.1 Uncharacterised protein [Zhongshania aliphaticivorans]CAA0098716.1 Uncharacterised protein [Zhongshania aliphaticivorans]